MFLPWLGGGVELFISSVHYYSTTLLNMCASLRGTSVPPPSTHHSKQTQRYYTHQEQTRQHQTQDLHTNQEHGVAPTHNTHTRHTKPYQLTHARPGDIPGQTHSTTQGGNNTRSKGGALAV